MLQKKSVLARLLANENVTVRQGNFPTASFDVVNRVLNLPLWKDMSNDLYDLLVGHEVSHALHTPADPKQLNIPNVPFSFVNVVEDIRIAYGAVGPIIRRNKELEKQYIGKTTEDLKNQLSKMKQDYHPFITPIDDQRSNKEYRLKVALNLLEQFINEL